MMPEEAGGFLLRNSPPRQRVARSGRALGPFHSRQPAPGPNGVPLAALPRGIVLFLPPTRRALTG
jgi:hypothetical protein